MKLSRSWLFVFQICIVISFLSCTNSSKGVSDGWQLEKLFSKEADVYEKDGYLVSLEPKTISSLITRENFSNDTLYSSYKASFSTKLYFVLKIDTKNEAGSTYKFNVIGVNDLKEKCRVIMCKDTSNCLEIAPLQDFGMSKSKQLLLVFPRINNAKDCDIKVVVRGLFNDFDKYEFAINPDELDYDSIQ